MSGMLDWLWGTFGRNGKPKPANPANPAKPAKVDQFGLCIAEVLKHEGGYVNDPQDPGGETNFGISKRSYPDEDIRAMTVERATAIYRRDFWPKVSGDQLPPGVNLAVFDFAVNSGPSRAIKTLQAALGVAQDGIIGPATMAALGKANAREVVQDVCRRRLAWLATLPGWPRFGRGWGRRVAEVRAKAEEMAAQAARP